MSMWRSPHKRGKWPTTKPTTYKNVGGSNKSGNQGSGVKHIPIQPPGYPSGKCLGAGREALCRCGTHNRSVRGGR